MAIATYYSLIILFCYAVLYSETADSKIVVLNVHNETVEEFPDDVIKYSANLLENLEGLVVLANPFNACDSIQKAFDLSVYASFVLIDGNVTEDCPGFLKILNAQKAGFDAAILFGSLSTSGKSSELIIPAFKVEYDVALKIMNNYASKRVNGSDSYRLKLIAVQVDPYGLFWLVLVLAAFVILLRYLCSISFYLCGMCRRLKPWCSRLLKKKPPKLKTKRYTAGDTGDKCAICLEKYTNGENLRVLTCKHEFHIKCVDTWLWKNSATCPLCLKEVILPDSRSLSSNNSDTHSVHSNEESPLIHSRRNETSSSDSSLLVQRVTGELVQILSEPNDPSENVSVQEGGGHVKLLVEVHNSNEIGDSHLSPSTHGSVNNCEESDEYTDALA